MNASNQHTAPDATQKSRSGIIDTIGNGFALLNRRPYLIWLPIALDVLLWTGLRVYVTDPLGGLISSVSGASSALGEVADSAHGTLSGIDLVSLSAVLVPTLLTDLDRGDMPVLSLAGANAVAGYAGLLSLLLAGIIGLLIGISYLTMVGRLVLDMPAWGFRFAWECVTNTARVLGLAGAIAVLLAFLFAPFVALGVALSYVGFDPLLMLVLTGAVIVVWAATFFVFGVHALALGVSGPIKAMRSSYLVVHRNLLSVMGLLLTVLLIRAGTPVALQVFTDSRWSVPFAIVVNAYVSTGLIVATMLYYFERTTDVITAPTAPVAAGATG